MISEICHCNDVASTENSLAEPYSIRFDSRSLQADAYQLRLKS